MTETRSHLAPGPLLRVRVRIGSGAPPGSGDTRVDRGHDVTVTAPAGTTVLEVVDLADLPLPHDQWALINLRSGVVAEPGDPFAGLAPLDGDHLLITDDASAAAYRQRRRTVARQTLDVLSGPAGGERHVLRDRTCTIGRDERRADVALPDPSLSREHLRIAQTPGGWTIEDLGSRNGSAVNGVALSPERPVALPDGAVIEAGRSTLRFRSGNEASTERRAARADGTIGFNCPPRVAPHPFERSIAAPEVPGRPRGPRLPLIAAIVPVIAGVALWKLTGQTLMLLFCLLAPVMAVATYASDKMGGRSDFKRLRSTFLSELDDLETEVAQQRAAELAQRLDLFPDASEVVRRMVEGDRRLWERRAAHHDDLHLRVGLAARPSDVVVALDKGGAPELRQELLARVPVQPSTPGTPVTIDLRERSPVGVSGPAAAREGVLRWLVLQTVALHSPRDVQVIAVLGEPLRRWDWLKWLPHVPSTGIGPSGAPAVGTSPQAVTLQLTALSELMRERRPDATQGHLDGPHTVVFVRDAAIEDRSLLGELLTSRAAEAGISVIWEADTRDALPGSCRTLLDLDPGRAVGTLADTVDRSTVADITIDSTPLAVAEEAAAAIAPVRDVTHSARGIASVPAIASLLDLEAARPISAGAVEARWAAADETLTFVLGAGQDGPLTLDLVEQGPHALVGGTSGSGKSELLRGALASMALRYPPSRLTFLLVDYKGGSAFRELAALPHAVGVVTDLDEHLADRALTSLRAEIRHRETVLSEHGALDLADLRRRSPQLVLPRLLIAIDEFATLAQEVPEFVDGVLDVVQRGRSLGVHLVLATQSPRGSVTSKIRANTALSIALRTLGREESADIIGSPEAAFIPKRVAGRAWANLGSNDLVPFQSAYVGGPPDAYEEERAEVVPFTLGSVDGAVGRASSAGPDTELGALGRAITDAFAASGRPLPRRPWLPELPAHVAAPPARDAHGAGWIGVVDDPARQRTVPLIFDPQAHGNLLILGGPRSGRTTALASLALSLATGRTTDLLQVYGLDCAGRALGAVESLPHCGAVVPADDAARTSRLLEMLTDELTSRRALIARLGAADVEDLQRRSDSPVPRILFLVDDFGAFTERYERAELGRLVDLMRQLITDGPSLGIHTAITADRRFAIPGTIHAVIGMRIVLRMGDREEYQRLGLPRSLERLELPNGRGFDIDGREVQLGTWSAADDEPLTATLTRIAADLEAQAPQGRARPRPVQLLPELFPAASLMPAAEPWQAALGLRERDFGTAVATLAGSHFMVVGPYRSGRSTAIASLVTSLRSSTPGLETHLVTNRVSPLETALAWSSVLASPTPEQLAALLEGAAGAERRPRIIAIDDATELDATMVNARLEAALRACRDAGCSVIASGESQAVFIAYGWLRELRKDGHGLLLSPNMETHGEIFGTKLPWRRSIEFPAGRGFLVHPGGRNELLQVAAPA